MSLAGAAVQAMESIEKILENWDKVSRAGARAEGEGITGEITKKLGQMGQKEGDVTRQLYFVFPENHEGKGRSFETRCHGPALTHRPP